MVDRAYEKEYVATEWVSIRIYIPLKNTYLNPAPKTKSSLESIESRRAFSS